MEHQQTTNYDSINEMWKEIFSVVQSELSSDTSITSSTVLFVRNKKGLSSKALILNGNTVAVEVIDNLEALAEKGLLYSLILFGDSLLSSPSYKQKLIKVHDILEQGGKLITFDFLLKTGMNHSDTEVQALSEKMHYETAIMATDIFKGKLQKYGFEATMSEDISAKLICKLDSRTLQQIFYKERLIFMKHLCSRIPGQDRLEPRLRDANGFRHRASAIVYRKNKETVEILLLKRRSKGWTFPGGGIEKDEDLQEAVLRECFEECGAVCNILRKFDRVTDDVRKTVTDVFLAEIVDLKNEYPESHRQRKWFTREFLHEKFNDLETHFFGKGSITTRAMLDMIWPTILAL